MTKFNLKELLDSASQRMRTDLADRFVEHPGEQGRNREEIIRQFLLSYLPNKFEISSGFAFDSSGQISKQLDIIVADALVCPRFETRGGIRFYPCESIVAVGQVKSLLSSCKELRSALDNLESVKALDRSAGGKSLDSIRQEPIENQVNYLHQIFTFLFVTGKVISAKRAGDELLSYLEKRPAHVWPNVLFALDNFLITYCCDDGICLNAMHARGISIQAGVEASNILMRFYLMLGRAIEVTRVSSLPYWEYLRQQGDWNAEVWYPASDEPPPFLRDIFGR